jgi:hypothetical protein
VKLSEHVGEVKISFYHAQTFVSTWFEPTDKIVIVGRRSEKSGNLDVVSQSMLASEFLQMNDESLESLIFEDDGSKWNLYFGVCPIKDDVTLTRRGTEANIEYVGGVWADIDVKEGGFASQQEIIGFLYGLALRPTIVVGSGSGGVHAYWKLSPGEKGNKELVERWWSYLDEEAGDKSIDKLIDLTRILRIPGSVYFPKEASTGKIGAVEILYMVPDTYTIGQIYAVSDAAFKTKHENRKRTIDNDYARRMDVGTAAQSLISNGNRWSHLRAYAEIEDYVNTYFSWDEILVPHGWTYLRDRTDGSREFARPGRGEKSAVVDFEGSPVMSLLSTSEETGLADLLDARIPLTKYRVRLRLEYNDDGPFMVRDLSDQILALAHT